MLGSIHDAEDVVQETYLRASGAYGRFEGRSSLRTWLYRITTRACLTALERRSRRPLPADLAGPSGDPDGPLAERPELPWLEPVPDALLAGGPADPVTTLSMRQSVRLAFVAALQHLPPQQRAVLILRDVLRYPTDETGVILGKSPAAVDSTLRRARTRLERIAPQPEKSAEPTSPQVRRLLDRYVTAFEAKDIPALVGLLTADVTWEMPPFTVWFQGPGPVGRHLAKECPAGPDDLRLVPTAANGQAAFALYMRDADGIRRPACLQVLDVTPRARIRHVVVFGDLRLFPMFGLPATLAPVAGPAAPAPTRARPATAGGQGAAGSGR